MRIQATYGEIIHIARANEKDYIKVVFDISDWKREYPNMANLILAIEREGAVRTVPVSIEGNEAVWSIGRDISNYPGLGKCQLTYVTQGNKVIAKSAIYDFIVTNSIGARTPTDQETEWIEQMGIFAEQSAGYAIGTFTDGETENPLYKNNNSKFYAGQSLDSAQSSESNAAAAALSQQNAALSAENAKQSEINIKTSEENAAQSANQASIHENSARAQADEAEAWTKGTIDGQAVGPDQIGYEDNAKYYYNLTKDIQGSVDTSTQDAKDSATAALASQKAAESAQLAAMNSQEAAQLSQEAAAGSANAAAESETNAGNSAAAALASQQAAKTSEDNALSSQQSAKQSEDNASGSAANALQSETNAKASETNAKTSETNASESAQTALDSQNAAKGSEDAAAGSATAANDSANEAHLWANNGNTAEGEVPGPDNNAKHYADEAAKQFGLITEEVKQAGLSAQAAKDSETKAHQWATFGTDTEQPSAENNAKYWCDQARGIVGGDYVTNDTFNTHLIDPNAHADVFSKKADKSHNFAATLLKANWILKSEGGNNFFEQDLNNPSFKLKGKNYFITPELATILEYSRCFIIGKDITQEGIMTFRAMEKPSTDLNIKIVMIDNDEGEVKG